MLLTTKRQVWLQGLTDQLTAWLKDFSTTIQSTIDDVEEHLMSLEDKEMKYNVQTKNVKEIVSFKLKNWSMFECSCALLQKHDRDISR